MRAFAAAKLALALDHIQHHVEQLPCLHLQNGGRQHAQSCARTNCRTYFYVRP